MKKTFAFTLVFLGLYSSQAQFLSIDSLKNILKDANDDTSRINLLNKICINYIITSDYEQAHDYGNHSLELAQKIRWKKGIAKSNICIGTIYQDESNYPAALEHGLRALKISEDIYDKFLIAKSLDNIGMAYYQQRLPSYDDTARNFYLKALSLNKALGNKSGVAKNYQNLGNLNYHSIEGLYYYKKALDLFQELKDSDEIARTLWDMAFVYQQVYHNYPLTFEYDFTALKTFETLGDKKGIGSCLWHIGDTYLYALQDISFHNPWVMKTPDSLLIKTHLWQQSEKYLLQAIKIHTSLGSLLDLKSDYADLQNVYQLMGDYKNAFDAYRIFSDLRDSIFSVKSNTQIANLTSTRDVELKQKQIEIQNLKLNSDLKEQWFLIAGIATILISSIIIILFYKRKRDANQLRKEAELKHQISDVEMKALRSQMNPHFIFNSLQSIQGFLLQNNSAEANTYLLKFSKLIRMVLENSQYTEVPLEEDLQSLELYMQLESLRLKHPFTYQIKIDETINKEETKIPPLILQPFIENAIWHGLQYIGNPGEIRIFIHKTNDTLIFTVEDNGVGIKTRNIPLEVIPMKKSSLGIKLTEERLKILSDLKKVKAHFIIEGIFDSKNKSVGTRVELSIPC